MTAVTSLKWRADADVELGQLQFLTTSTDGHVFAWIFAQNELKIQFKVQMTDSGS